jgi:hypothetical protein
MRKFCLLLVALAVVGFGQNLLVNGDFEQPRSIGWIRTAGGLGNTQIVSRDTGYQPDSDYEILVWQDGGSGWLTLSQMVDVPGTDLTLTFAASFEVDGSGTCYPVACFRVRYCDAGGGELGETRYYCHNANCPWTSTSTVHLVDVPATGWNSYTLEIAQELNDNLPGVVPASVAKVEIALFDTTSGS